ncbi:hypothetical protein LEP1GSC047_0461 [Leptospira inadai serovar Lyme str. 10]|uniref:Uncharacterized protein n=2 Tax=Leptospira inadai serovar Lyme TaxID=293084 RepID=V6HB82_9LEPT|nr:hypothetical protein [Leptospira inadai]EQA35823.1 hypothetical protein LEP1GSC047_0461 [Leptospira inadai serovar Lyme str. 10]PNV76938.1 hypothetical protein BES34_001290 [Leptospira inadai serovar Lyme]
MISYTVYKLVHILGILFLFLAFGGIALHVIGGGTKENAQKKLIAMTHGIGLFLILLGGFGMLARLGIIWPWPGWIIAKFLFWLLFGGLLTLFYKKPSVAKFLWFSLPFLGVIVGYIALYKPF